MFKKIDTTNIIVVALIGAGAVYLVKKSFQKVEEVVGEVVEDMTESVKENIHLINPVNKENFINASFTKIYQDIFGSTQDLGSDIYDYLHPPEKKE